MAVGRGERTALTPAALTPTAVSALAHELRQACMRISRRIRFEGAAEIAPHQFGVLSKLADTPRTPGELASMERVSAPSMTRTVSGLVERGLVVRMPDPEDGRQVICSLSEQGRRVIRDVVRQRDEWMTLRVKALTPADQEILRQASQILQRVADE